MTRRSPQRQHLHRHSLRWTHHTPPPRSHVDEGAVGKGSLYYLHTSVRPSGRRPWVSSSSSSSSSDTHSSPPCAAWPAHALYVPLPAPRSIPVGGTRQARGNNCSCKNKTNKFLFRSSHARAQRCDNPPIWTYIDPSEGAKRPRMGSPAPMHPAAPGIARLVSVGIDADIDAGIDVSVGRGSARCWHCSTEGSHRRLCVWGWQQL